MTAPRIARRFFLLFSICTVVGVFFAHRLFVIRRDLDHTPIAWGAAVRWSLANWYVWGATACLVVVLARRFPVERDRWRSRVAIHAVASVAVALLHLALCTLWFWGVESRGDRRGFVEQYRVQLLINFHWDVLIYAGVVAATQAHEFQRRSRERALRTAALEGELAKAQLSALQAQLQPHFLFNALNAVAALVHEDPAGAELVVVRLSELLRSALLNADVLEVPLEEELEFAQKYLDVERVRFGDRLRVTFEVEPSVLSCRVPSLVLQPLVENAVRHGASKQSAPCAITIAASESAGVLRLEVRDTGRGAASDTGRAWPFEAGRTARVDTGRGASFDAGAARAHDRPRVGLSNTRARLEKLYGRDASLSAASSPRGGWTARIHLPVSRAATRDSAGVPTHA